MSPPRQIIIEEVKTQLELVMSKPVGISVNADVDRELTPVLTQMLTLRTGEIQHPVIRSIVDWLVNPQCTSDIFNYVVGPLSQYVYKLKVNEFDRLQPYAYHIYLYQVAIESLALKCPILEGPWEHAAWLVVRIFKMYVDSLKSVWNSYTTSDTIAAWIVCVIGDANLCPNPHLRLEFICLLRRTNIFVHNRVEALESILLAVSAMDFKYLDVFHCGEFSMISFKDIVEIFQLINSDDMFEYSHKLAIKLEIVKSSRLSSVFNDITYRCSVNPSKYNNPYELNIVTNLLKTITGYVHIKLQESEEEGRNFNIDSRLENVISVVHMFWIMIHNFKECLLLPQLISITSSFIMEVMEFICLTSRGLCDEESRYAGQPYLKGIKYVNSLLDELCDEHGYEDIIHSPLGQEIWCRYSTRLKSLRTRLTNVLTFSNVQALIFYDMLLEKGIVKLPQMHEMRW